MSINPITSQFNIKRKQNSHTQVMPRLDTFKEDTFAFSTSPVSSVKLANPSFKGIDNLMEAIKNGDLETVKKELANGTDINGYMEMELPNFSDGKLEVPPITCAVYYNQLEIMDELFKHDDLDINVNEYRIVKPLILASACNQINLETFKKLLSHPNINVNVQDKYAALHYVCDDDSELSLKKFKELIKNPNIDINIQDDDNHTALHIVCKDYSESLKRFKENPNISLEKLKELIKHPNLNVNVQDKDDKTALHLLCNPVGLKNCFEETKELLKHPDIDINLQDKSGNTALHYACKCSNWDQIEEILKHPDVDLTIKNRDGETVFDICKDYKEITKLLNKYQRGEDNREFVYSKTKNLKSTIEIDKLTPEKNIWTKEEIGKHFLKLIYNEDFKNAMLMLSRTPLIDLEADDNKILKKVAKTGNSDFIEKVD